MVKIDLSQVKLRFAVRSDDLVHIRAFDQHRGTTKGRPTDLSCPECDARVVPVLSPTHQITDHFRHEAETSCVISGSGESAVHFNAKAVLAQELNKFHSASLVYQCGMCRNWYPFLKIEHYDYAKPELKISNRRRPDVSCVSGGDVVGAAEVFHTHAVDFEKKADLNAAGLAWFEIPAASVHRQHFKPVESANIFSIDAAGAGITYPVTPRVCEPCEREVERRRRAQVGVVERQVQAQQEASRRWEQTEAANIQRQRDDATTRNERAEESRMRRAFEWKKFKATVEPNTTEALLVAGCEAEKLIPDLDKYGIRLTSKMSGALYIAVANHRNKTFLRVARENAAMEE